MSAAKFRLKLLTKLAQTVVSQPATSNATTPNTTTNAAVPPDPSPLASSLYPTIRVGFDPARVSIIETLVKMLSLGANIATNGKYNFQNLRNQNFQFDPSSLTSPDQKNLLVFFLKVYKTLLNGGQPFTTAVTADQVKQMVPFLLQSPELANLSQINPTGQISQKSNLSGSFKDNIRDLVARLQPTVPTRRA